MKKSIYINKPTYEMLEFISKKNGKSVSSFLDSWALQEYDDYQNKPFKKIEGLTYDNQNQYPTSNAFTLPLQQDSEWISVQVIDYYR